MSDSGCPKIPGLVGQKTDVRVVPVDFGQFNELSG